MESAWIAALIGGALIGLASSLELLLAGRIAGISGIYAGLFFQKAEKRRWRVEFVAGLILGGLIASLFLDHPFINESGRSLGLIALAGLLVGFGTKLGSGCTSGHGVCGISRLSRRSILATLTFMGTGIVTVAVMSALTGGQ